MVNPLYHLSHHLHVCLLKPEHLNSYKRLRKSSCVTARFPEVALTAQPHSLKEITAASILVRAHHTFSTSLTVRSQCSLQEAFYFPLSAVTKYCRCAVVDSPPAMQWQVTRALVRWREVTSTSCCCSPSLIRAASGFSAIVLSSKLSTKKTQNKRGWKRNHFICFSFLAFLKVKKGRWRVCNHLWIPP